MVFTKSGMPSPVTLDTRRTSSPSTGVTPRSHLLCTNTNFLESNMWLYSFKNWTESLSSNTINKSAFRALIQLEYIIDLNTYYLSCANCIPVASISQFEALRPAESTILIGIPFRFKSCLIRSRVVPALSETIETVSFAGEKVKKNIFINILYLKNLASCFCQH